jgi:hypothetical protein
MKVLTQKYRVIVSNPAELSRGRMVIGFDRESVIGFVDYCDDVTGVAEFILFEPMEIEMDDTMESLAERIDNWEELFGEALRAAQPRVQEMWRDTVVKEINEGKKENN